jgi:hypothetical protein
MMSAYTNPEPVFIVGMNGSGTTMLLDNLGRHPALYAFPKETRLIPYFIAHQDSFGNLHHDDNFKRLWIEVLGLHAFQLVNNNTDVPLPKNWKDFPRSLAAVLDGAFTYFSRQAGKLRWCEKTPQHVQHIMPLAELFSQAKFIHMIRDGRDCAASLNRRWRRTPELTVYRWKNIVTNGSHQGLQLGNERYLEVRYEDLTMSPEKWLRQICNFLNMPFDTAVLESAQPYMQTNKSGGKSLQPNSGQWESYFEPKIRRKLEIISGNTLAKFGYNTNYPNSNDDISSLKRRYWSAKDALVQYFREIMLKLTGRINRPWHVILSKPFIAFKQRGRNKY